MSILTIRHNTTYQYKNPVAFGAHQMMLRPRDDDDQRIIEADIAITPTPSHVSWARDSLGNHVATAFFEERASELRFQSFTRLDHTPVDFRPEDIEESARTCPFAYAEEEMPHLAPFMKPLSVYPKLDQWAATFLRDDGSADTYALLAAMTQTIKQTFKHMARHEKGIQDPVQTLELGSGSCRDHALLMIAALRSVGFAARFVSGYLHLVDDDDEEDEVVGGNTHAWVQVYIPGADWVDFDPSSGAVGNQNLVRVAVVHEPMEAIPLRGTWIGAASDHLAMKVAVKVCATRAG